jgi:hypothetical protein
VSAFGEGGNGDSGDVWTVVCDGDFWRRDGEVMLKHVDTGAYLSASGHTFGRPINGQVGKSVIQYGHVEACGYRSVSVCQRTHL